jgi:lactate permease
MACMAIMPWGTLGLAMVVGAALVHLEPETLAARSALVSAPVFIVLSGVAAWLGGGRTPGALLAVGLQGVVFVAVLCLASATLGPEVAGVCAGGTIVVLGLVAARLRHGRGTAPWPSAAWPYLLLLACVIALKLLVAAWPADVPWVVQGRDVAWKPLASPGLALLVVCAAVWYRQVRASGASAGWWRAWGQRVVRPLATILCFLLMSQVMVKAGLLAGLQGALSTAGAPWLPFVVAALGGVGGYLTASSIGGNVLMLPTLAELPAAPHGRHHQQRRRARGAGIATGGGHDRWRGARRRCRGATPGTLRVGGDGGQRVAGGRGQRAAARARTRLMRRAERAQGRP